MQLEPAFAINIDIDQVAPLDAVWQKQQAKKSQKGQAESDSEESENDSEESEESDEDSDDKPKFTNWSKRQKKGLEQVGGDTTQDRRQKKFNSQQQRNKARSQKNRNYDD